MEQFDHLVGQVVVVQLEVGVRTVELVAVLAEGLRVRDLVTGEVHFLEADDVQDVTRS